MKFGPWRRDPKETLRITVAAVWLALALLAQPGFGWQSPAPAKTAPSLTPAERKAAAAVKMETIRKVTTALAADDMQGRGTAQPGGDKAANYIAGRFAALGLKPLGESASYLQPIKFRISQTAPESYVKAGAETLKLVSDFVPAPPISGDKTVEGKLVFAGYGRQSELKDLDVEGKVAFVVIGPPKNVEKAQWMKENSPQAIGFRLMGKKAAGVIFAGYGDEERPYSMIADYLTRRSVALADGPAAPSRAPFLLVSDAGAEKLFSGSGTTYKESRAAADSGESAARALETVVKISILLKQETGTGSNVVGVLEGSDPVLKDQAVVYSAHYDAYGVGPNNRIFPGAADNALGVGEIIGIAEALAHGPSRPRRSVIFLAVTGEEYGLLGAEYWAQHPTWKIQNVAADVNFDGIGTEVYGPVKHIVGFGMEHSNMGPILEEVVAATGNSIAPDPFPEEGVFYRSDHFAFVKKGVPSLMLLGGPAIDTAAFRTRAKKWMATDYHQPGDTVRTDWDWSGPQTLSAVGLVVGMRVANADAMPSWLPSSPFNKPRDGGPPAKQP